MPPQLEGPPRQVVVPPIEIVVERYRHTILLPLLYRRRNITTASAVTASEA